MKYRLVQIASGTNPYDAITHDIKEIQNSFLQNKDVNFIHSSKIYAEHIGKNLPIKVNHISSYIPKANDITIVHYSTVANFLHKIKTWPGKKILIYHNITPGFFFSDWNLNIAGKQIRARSELFKLSRGFDLSFADSQFNAFELTKLGFLNVTLRPILIPNTAPKNPITNQNKQNSLLYVGRIVPNKGIHHLIKTFYFFNKMQKNSSLNIIGSPSHDFDNYYNKLLIMISQLGLKNKIKLLGQVSSEELTKFYKQSNIFTSLSEHEGFCVPLLEAMQNQLPVVAFGNNTSAIEETLDDAGILIKKNDILWTSDQYIEIAALWKLILKNDALQKDIINRQDRRLKKYNMDELKLSFIQQVREIL